MIIDPRLHRIVVAQTYPLLFATISGAHLYGFPSPDSDFDLRGGHVVPLEKVVQGRMGCGRLGASWKPHERQKKRFSGAQGQSLGGEADGIRPRGAGGSSRGRPG